MSRARDIADSAVVINYVDGVTSAIQTQLDALGEDAFTRSDFIATNNQTVFNIDYTVGFIQVWHNGVLLPESDYTATNGTSFTLDVGANTNDEITAVALNTFSVANALVAADIGSTVQQDLDSYQPSTATLDGINDYFLIQDANDSNNLKRVAASEVGGGLSRGQIAGLILVI